MTRKTAMALATRLGSSKLAPKLIHNYMVLTGDKIDDTASAIVETCPNIDEDEAREIAAEVISELS